MPRKWIVIIFVLLLILPITGYCGDASADKDDAEMERLLKTMNSLTDIATRERMNADFVPGMVTVLYADDLLKKGVRTVGEAIAFVPGMSISETSDSLRKTVIRGVPGQTAAGHLKVLIDGFSMTTAFGMDPAPNMPIEQVERIEIMRGAGSAIHGEYAYGGVMNIITRKTENQVFWSLGKEDGSAASLTAGGNASFRYDPDENGAKSGDIFEGSLNYAYLRTPSESGISSPLLLPEPSDNGIADSGISFSGRAGSESDENHSVIASFRWNSLSFEGYRLSDSTDRFSGPNVVSLINSNLAGSATGVIKTPISITGGFASYETDFSIPLKLTVKAGWQEKKIDHDMPPAVSDEPSGTGFIPKDGRETLFSGEGELQYRGLKKHTITVGYTYTRSRLGDIRLYDALLPQDDSGGIPPPTSESSLQEQENTPEASIDANGENEVVVDGSGGGAADITVIRPGSSTTPETLPLTGDDDKTAGGSPEYNQGESPEDAPMGVAVAPDQNMPITDGGDDGRPVSAPEDNGDIVGVLPDGPPEMPTTEPEFGIGSETDMADDANDEKTQDPAVTGKRKRDNAISSSDAVIYENPEDIFDNADKTRVLHSVSIDDEYRFSDYLTLFGGVRYDHYEADDGFSISDQTSPRFAAVYRLNPGPGEKYRHILKAQYGRSFRPPSFFDIYRDLVNPPYAFTDPETETNDTYELGYILRTNTSLMRATLFYSDMETRVDDTLIAESLPDNGLTDGVAKGLELEWESRLFNNIFSTKDALSFSGSISYIHTRDSETGEGFPEASEWLMNLALIYEPTENLDITFRYNMIGDRNPISEDKWALPGRIETGALHLADITASYNFPQVKGLGLSLGVKNLFEEDTRYYIPEPDTAEPASRFYWMRFTLRF